MDIMMIRRVGINNRLAKVSGIQQEDGHVQDSLVAHHRFHHLIHYWGQQRWSGLPDESGKHYLTIMYRGGMMTKLIGPGPAGIGCQCL